MQYISVCPACGHVYGHGNVRRIPCSHCGESLTTYSGYTKEEWEQLPKEKKDTLIADVQGHKPVNSPLETPPCNGAVNSTSSSDGTVKDTSSGERMIYRNTGKAIGDFATICCLASIVLGLIFAVLLYRAFESFLLSIAVFAVGFIMSYLGYLLLAAFGELVENSTTIVKLLSKSK